MNTTKTKGIWIGGKRHSSEKLPVSFKISWGTATFNLLGILFSVNPDDIPELNFLKLLDKSKKLINIWKRIS